MRKLFILPGACATLGGTLVTLSMLIKGFEKLGALNQLCVLVRAGTAMEQYLDEAGQGACLWRVTAKTQTDFLKQGLQIVAQQPPECPLLLDNCVMRQQILTLIEASPALRWSGRPVYHFFHDLALSKKYVGFLARKTAFTLLSPVGICNSHFTAAHIQRFVRDIQGVLYQPVDTERFNDRPVIEAPAALQPILRMGDRIILTPSRISQPGLVNDKNLTALVPMLAHLRAKGYLYHCVLIGDDRSPEKVHSQALMDSAKALGVAEHFTILPPAYDIENYYKAADIMVTLAPREPFGRTVVEAIACGIPVVGSRTGGIGEILQNISSEWQVDPTNPIAAAETILRVAEDPHTAERLTRGKQWVKNECSLTHYAQKIMTITGLASTKRSVNALQAIG